MVQGGDKDVVRPVAPLTSHVHPSVGESIVWKCPVVAADQAAERVAVKPDLVLQTDCVSDPRAVVIESWNILTKRPAVFLASPKPEVQSTTPQISSRKSQTLEKGFWSHRSAAERRCSLFSKHESAHANARATERRGYIAHRR